MSNSQSSSVTAPDTQFLLRPGGRIAFDVTHVTDGPAGITADGPVEGAADITAFTDVIGGPASGPADSAADRPLVVCLPGMGDLRSTFRHLRPSLVAAGYRVATMDLRGHGDSDTSFNSYDDEAAAADALALIHQLGGPAILVGNSMAAGAAVIAAAKRPAAVSALVLIGPFVRVVPVPAVMRWMLRLAMAGPWSTAVWLGYLPRLYPTRRGQDFADHRAAIGASLRRPGRARAFRRTTRTDHTPAWQAAQQIAAATPAVPTLVVMGGKDPDFPDPAAEARLVADTLHGQLMMVPGAGHYPQSEFPEVTGPAVVDFLQRSVRHA